MTAPTTLEPIGARIRTVLHDHGRLNRPIEQIADDADLYQAGMNSHASVNVMLALESAFDVEFPDHMLKRSVFGSIASVQDALQSLIRT